MDLNHICKGDLATLDKTQAAIFELENAVLTMPQYPLENRHLFSGGMYAREMFIPAGVLVTGKIHLKDHICILHYCDVTIANAEGSKRYVGSCSFAGKAGSKRAFMAHEDSLFTVVHITEKTTVEEAEFELVTNEFGGGL